jgi:DNA-binding transcriptional ArsR family regulator
MRHSLLDALFPKIRAELLAATLLHPGRAWYVSDLARHLGVQPSSLQRELAALAEAGILRRRKDGNRVYYQADTGCPLFPELRGLMLKTAGLCDVLRETLGPFGDRIDDAFIYGSFARATEVSARDIDVMVVGRVGFAELAPALKVAEEQLGRAVNPSVYTPEEIAKKLASGHHFLRTVMDGEKLFIRGDEGDLATALGRKSRARPRDEQAGA